MIIKMLQWNCLIIKYRLNTIACFFRTWHIISCMLIFISLLDNNRKDIQNYTVPRDSVKIQAPITNPEKIVCIGMNYRDHCLEQNAPVPQEPVVFSKFPSCIIGPYDDLPYPKETQVFLIFVHNDSVFVFICYSCCFRPSKGFDPHLYFIKWEVCIRTASWYIFRILIGEETSFKQKLRH